MALLEIFKSRPKWQHSDPAVRVEAVRDLAAEEQTLLASIARGDADARVRRTALRRLREATVLEQIARGDADASVRAEAREHLLSFLLGDQGEAVLDVAIPLLSEAKDLAALAKGAAREVVRLAALGRLSDPRALAAIAREAGDGAVRLAALSKLTDPALRVGVATGSDHRDVAFAALETVSDRGGLKAVAARAKIKAVARRARAMLDALSAGPEPLSAADRHARLGEICRSLEALVHSRDWEHISAEVAAAEVAWAEMAPCTGDDALTERYDSARRAVHAGLAHLAQEREAHQREEAARREARQALEALCDQAEALAGDDVLTRLEVLRTAWAALGPIDDPEMKALGVRFESACHACRARVEAGAQAAERDARREALAAEMEALAASADPLSVRPRAQAIEREVAVLACGASDAIASRYETARARCAEREAEARAARAEQERQNLARLTRLADRLEKLVGAEAINVKDASRCLREAAAAAAEPPPLPTRRERDALLERFEAARKALYPRVQAEREDDEWRRWANVSVQEELCREVEGLLEVGDLDEVARRVKATDARWKTAREVPREQGEALRERFRKAREEISTRLAAHFAQVSAERQENLRRKEALCEQAEALSESRDWAKTAESLRGLQEQWKTIGPVPRESTEAVWQRFRGACDRFFTRFKEHRHVRAAEWGENLKRKEALCARAEELATSDDWEKTAAELRDLQEQWKKIGAVKRVKAEAVWQRFRAACDAFFQRYARRDEISAAASLAEREELVRRVEALLPADGAPVGAAPEGLAAEVLACQASWRKAGRTLDAASQPLSERLERACLRLTVLYPTAFAGTELDPEAALKRMEKLCARVEALLAECEPGGTGADAADLAERLRNALAANAMGGKAEREARWHAVKDEVEAARAAWSRLGPASTERAEPLARRFHAACERFFAMRRPVGGEPRRRATAR